MLKGILSFLWNMWSVCALVFFVVAWVLLYNGTLHFGEWCDTASWFVRTHEWVGYLVGTLLVAANIGITVYKYKKGDALDVF